MLIAAFVVLGAASFIQLGVDIFPKIDLPTITITTRLPGASPEEIESQITKPIEEVVNTISSLDQLRSTTIAGQRSTRESTETADKRIKRQLETVKDVGAITPVGDRKREIQVLVDPHKLTAFGLSIQQVKDALLRQNVEIPGGRVTEGGRG